MSIAAAATTTTALASIVRAPLHTPRLSKPRLGSSCQVSVEPPLDKRIVATGLYLVRHSVFYLAPLFNFFCLPSPSFSSKRYLDPKQSPFHQRFPPLNILPASLTSRLTRN